MAHFMYEETHPDMKDLDNRTGECPGFVFSVSQNDGYVIFATTPAVDDPDPMSVYGVVVEPKEAEAIMKAVQDAIDDCP